MRRFLATFLLALGLLTAGQRAASAQSSPVGVRAAGMGGAFTAVADDGTAPYWNPAGLASGAFVGVSIDVNSLDRQSTQFIGLATPPLGLSYFHEEVRATSTAPDPSGRNVAVDSFAVHHAGGTLVQSLGDTGLAVGTTIGVVHGHGATAFSADAGVMLSGALGRIGLTVRNLTEPELGGVRLERTARGGVAVHLRQDLTVAADAEFTKAATASGDWREAAVGLEAHPHPRVWVRSGFHWNTAGTTAAPIGSAGGGVVVYGAIRADAQVSFGSKDGNRGWGAGLSFVY
jgi:hypothetical protein